MSASEPLIRARERSFYDSSTRKRPTVALLSAPVFIAHNVAQTVATRISLLPLLITLNCICASGYHVIKRYKTRSILTVSTSSSLLAHLLMLAAEGSDDNIRWSSLIADRLIKLIGWILKRSAYGFNVGKCFFAFLFFEISLNSHAAAHTTVHHEGSK